MTTKKRTKAEEKEVAEADARGYAEACAEEAYEAAYKAAYDSDMKEYEDHVHREGLEALFYEALKLAAPDLDYTAIPPTSSNFEPVVFRVNNGPVSADLNSVLGLCRRADPETGEDVCAIDIGNVEETILDLRDLAAARDHANPAEAQERRDAEGEDDDAVAAPA